MTTVNSRKTFWFIFLLAIVVIGIFFYARYQNEKYGATLVSSSVNPALSTYTNTTYGFSISYPNEFIATSTFASSYLLPTYWNIYSTEGSGEQVVAIEYPGSNNILSSELRIGVSNDPTQIKTCDIFNSNVTKSTHALDGEHFYVGTMSDAAMSHFSYTKSYRIVHDGYCYALDLVSFGTNPEVSSPPKTVPFDQKTAEAALDQVIESFTFTN